MPGGDEVLEPMSGNLKQLIYLWKMVVETLQSGGNLSNRSRGPEMSDHSWGDLRSILSEVIVLF
jgi:hypothetical protein